MKVDQEALDNMEVLIPRISESIAYFEAAEIPVCPSCGSDDTASVQVGIVSMSIHIASATTKFKLVPNMKDKKADYYCNSCQTFFNSP